MPIKFIGRTNDFKGKTLWEILGNLKNFGVGRIIVRNRFQRYPEPSYIKVLKVGALPDPPPPEYVETDKFSRPEAWHINCPRKVMILCERVFRGRKDAKLVQIDSASYKADYMLIPKDQEHKYQAIDEKTEILMPRTVEFPPLMKELLIRQFKAKGQVVKEEPKLPLLYNRYGNKTYRIAKDGETPTVKVTIGLGTPASPNLYANCKPI